MAAVKCHQRYFDGIVCRERTGKGQLVNVDLYSSAINAEITAISSVIGCRETGMPSFGRTASHYYSVYKTKDGRYLSIGTIEPKFWQKMCRLIDLPELESRQFDLPNSAEIKEKLAAAFAGKLSRVAGTYRQRRVLRNANPHLAGGFGQQLDDGTVADACNQKRRFRKLYLCKIRGEAV